jgi:hypothetical protein
MSSEDIVLLDAESFSGCEPIIPNREQIYIAEKGML